MTWLWDSSAFAGQEDPNFYFFTHYETHSCSGTAQIRLQLQHWGELFSLSCPSSAKQGGLTPPASACGDPAREGKGLIVGLGWIQPEHALVCTQGSPAGTAGGQESTKLPFSVKNPAHQVLYVQLFKGISAKGQDHSYSKLQERRVRGSQAVSESHRNTLAHILYIMILSTDQ